MTRDELMWLTGWLEGEGTFCYTMSKGNSPRIIVEVFSADLDTLQKAHRLMGTKGITTIPPRECRGTQWKSKGGYRTTLQAAAAALMNQLLPFMGLRRTEQITTALKAWESRPSKPMAKLCACGCGETVFAGRRTLYANQTGSCAQRAYRSRQKESPTCSISP